MSSNRLLRKLFQLGVAGVLAFSMLGVFFAVGGIAPGADGQVAMAAKGGNGGGKGQAKGHSSTEKHGNGHSAKLDDGTRPGWGCGDQNHEHTGPPGNPDAESPCKTEAITTTETVTETETESTTDTLTEALEFEEIELEAEEVSDEG
jgi:hypothetical protein